LPTPAAFVGPFPILLCIVLGGTFAGTLSAEAGSLVISFTTGAGGTKG